jgi:hypothetical protein
MDITLALTKSDVCSIKYGTNSMFGNIPTLVAVPYKLISVQIPEET